MDETTQLWRRRIVSQVYTPQDFIAAGFALVPIRPGTKSPERAGWNQKHNAITTVEELANINGHGLGLAHAYSTPITGAVDVDEMELAREYLRSRNIDLDALLADADAVRVVGREGRAKLLYALPKALPLVQHEVNGQMAFELRCADNSGSTVQDVIYGTHPDTGDPYRVEGNIFHLPTIPDALLAMWEGLAGQGEAPANIPPPEPMDADRVREALGYLDPDDRAEWVRVGQNLYPEGETGRELWVAWSKTGTKWRGAADERKWDSFTGTRSDYRAIYKRARSKGWTPPGLECNPNDPIQTARQFLAWWEAELLWWNGEFYTHRDGYWADIETALIEARIYMFLQGATANANGRPFNPTKAKVANVLHAMERLCIVRRDQQPPTWLRGAHGDPDPADLVPFRNGLLHIRTRKLHPPTNRLFNVGAVAFDYDPTAPEPGEWMDFLYTVWEDDLESVASLQEIFGYLISGQTYLQKIFYMVGQTRSGKGTIARILRDLFSRNAVVSPSLNSLAEPFGLQPLVHASVATINDARLSGKSDKAAVVERMLSISGEDDIEVHRKYLGAWYGKLPSRFLLMSNEVPNLRDNSQALTKRLVLLRMPRSFYGKEDHGLYARLHAELPGILNWALEGYDRLRSRGRFIQPASSADLLAATEAQGSPLRAFVGECCVLGEECWVVKKDLVRAYRGWCEDDGSRPMFGDVLIKELLNNYPALSTAQCIVDGQRARVLRGIGLLDVHNEGGF
jgi:putative DNA primase/helicase